MNTYSLYSHTSPSGKVYIGITKNKPEWRWNNGKGYKRNQTLFGNAIIKYGWDNIIHEVLFTGLSAEEAKRLEIAYISYYKSLGLSYNITDGGDGGTGNKSHLGQKTPDEVRLKMSLSHKGKKHPNRKRRDPNTIKIGKDNKASKPAYQYTLTGELIKQWHCISDIERELGIFATNVCSVCNGKNFTVGGFRWSYDYPYVFPEEEKTRKELCRKRISEKAREGFASGKRKPNRSMLGKTGSLAPMYGKRGGFSPLSKCVYQYDRNGIFIKKWNCIKEAANEIGAHSTSISAACKGKLNTVSGFRWSYDSPENVVFNFQNNMKNSGKPRKVFQFDCNGKYIKEWNSTMEIERSLGFRNSIISKACRNNIMAKNYYWSYTKKIEAQKQIANKRKA